MEQQRPTTLKLLKSLRESSSAIKGFSTLSNLGSFISYDDQAIRTWNLQKQVKALHNDSKDERTANLQFFALSPLDAIDCFLVFYTVKKGSDQEGGFVRVLSPQLKVLQEVS
jgi:hypothetical protein